MAALTALSRKNCDVNGGEPKKLALLALTGEIAAVTVLNRKNSGVNDVDRD